MTILDKLKGKGTKKPPENEAKDAIRGAYKKAISKKKWEEAIDALKKLIAVEPESESWKLKLGELLVSVNRKEEATNHYLEICKTYEEEGQYRKAKAIANILRRMDPAGEEIQKMDIEIEARLGFYKHPLFAELSEGEFGEIIQKASFRKYPKKTIVIQEGEPGESLYMVCSGKIDAYVKNKEKGIAELIAQFRKDNFFGEGGFLTGSKRTATLITTEETILIELVKNDIEEILEKNPNISKMIEKYYHKRQSASA